MWTVTPRHLQFALDLLIKFIVIQINILQGEAQQGGGGGGGGGASPYHPQMKQYYVLLLKVGDMLWAR